MSYVGSFSIRYKRASHIFHLKRTVFTLSSTIIVMCNNGEILVLSNHDIKLNAFKLPFTVWGKNAMMTSSNGAIFRVTGPLCGEFTGHR